jgi:hypothetical protein
VWSGVTSLAKCSGEIGMTHDTANTFLLVFAGGAVLFVALVLLLRPPWAQLSYDAALWRFAWDRTQQWSREYLGAEAAVIIASIVVGISATNGSAFERTLAGVWAGAGSFLLGFVLLLVYNISQAPSALHDVERTKAAVAQTRVRELESRLKPTIVVSCLVRDYGSHKRVAAVHVQNDGTEQLRNCTGRINKIDALVGDTRLPIGSASMYVSWSLGDGGGKFNTFQSEGVLDIVVIEQPYMGQAFVNGVVDGGERLRARLQEPNRYIVTVEVAAENCARVVQECLFYVDPIGQHAKPDRAGGQTTVELPDIVFELVS